MNRHNTIRRYLLVVLTPLGAVGAGVVAASTGGGDALLMVSSISLAVFSLAAIVLRLVGSRRCPACGDRRFPSEPTAGIYECDSCGVRFRRTRQGAATWLDLDDPPPVGAKRIRRVTHGVYQALPPSPDGRWAWIGQVLPRLRALRQHLRPLADKPVHVLNLIKPVGGHLDVPEHFPTLGSPRTIPRVWNWRSALAIAVDAVIIGAAAVSMIPNLARLYRLDDVYWIIVVFAIGACECMVLAISQMLHLRRTAALALLAADLSLKALHLAAIGRLPDAYVLGSMAVVFPTTPLLLAPLFRRWRAVEESAGEFTSGQLLRSKQARASLNAARRAG